MDQLRSINTFIRAAQKGSFSKAARDLQITPQAASLQVRQLENLVGVRLFHRTTRKISLTEEGRRFYEQCKAGVDLIDNGVRDLRDATDEVVGTIRMALPRGAAETLVATAISRFLAQFPRVSFELIVENEHTDIIDQRIDIGMGARPDRSAHPDSSLIVRNIAPIQFVLCASPDYLRRRGVPRTIADLQRHCCIHMRVPKTGKILRWEFYNDAKEVIDIETAEQFIVNDMDFMREAALSGIGIARLANCAAQPHIRAKRLTPVLTQYTPTPVNFYLYMPRRTQIPKKSRVFADFLFNELRGHADSPPLELPDRKLRHLRLVEPQALP